MIVGSLAEAKGRSLTNHQYRSPEDLCWADDPDIPIMKRDLSSSESS
ncbi:hypothetical protein [Leptolyngbya sp. CCNP1308]|nr:hypothetical protein [Leptolyngbya sp. CCNP1308]